MVYISHVTAYVIYTHYEHMTMLVSLVSDGVGHDDGDRLYVYRLTQARESGGAHGHSRFLATSF